MSVGESPGEIGDEVRGEGLRTGSCRSSFDIIKWVYSHTKLPGAGTFIRQLSTSCMGRAILELPK